MNDKKYCNYFKEARNGTDCINFLFAHTAPDGKLLYVDDRNDKDMNDDNAYYYESIMHWGEADRDEAVSKLTVLCEQLRKIAEADDFSSDPELNEIYQKYLAPIDAGDLDMERISEIGENLFFEADNVSEEDHDYYGKWECLFRKEADKRLGCNAFSMSLLSRARRYYRLIKLGAPKIISNAEEVKLAKEFVMFNFCSLECEIDTHCEEPEKSE